MGGVDVVWRLRGAGSLLRKSCPVQNDSASLGQVPNSRDPLRHGQSAPVHTPRPTPLRAPYQRYQAALYRPRGQCHPRPSGTGIILRPEIDGRARHGCSSSLTRTMAGKMRCSLTRCRPAGALAAWSGGPPSPFTSSGRLGFAPAVVTSNRAQYRPGKSCTLIPDAVHAGPRPRNSAFYTVQHDPIVGYPLGGRVSVHNL